MKIWIMRHGEAGFNASQDSQRTLTSSGKEAVFLQGKRLGERVKAQQIHFDKILVSPYLRTQETLKTLIEGLQAVEFTQDFANVIENWEEITPSGSPALVHDYLAFLNEEGAKNVLIVSHLPLVFDLVQHFTQFKQSVHFYPAVIAEINWNGVKGEVEHIEMP